MKKILMLVFMIAAMIITGCGGSQSQSDSSGKVLRVGTDANFPPFEYYQTATKTHTGFEVELIQALAQKMGYEKVEFVNAHFNEIFKGLDEKKYDVAIAGFTSDAGDRTSRYGMSDTYLDDGFKIVVKTDSKMGDAAADLEGKTVAVEKDSSALELVKKLTGGRCKTITCGSTEDAIKAVLDGKADCMVASKLAVGFFLANGYGDKARFAGDTVLEADKIAMAVRKDDAEMLKKLNGALAEYKKTSTFDQLRKTYFGSLK